MHANYQVIDHHGMDTAFGADHAINRAGTVSHCNCGRPVFFGNTEVPRSLSENLRQGLR